MIHKYDNHGRPLDFETGQLHVQLEAFAAENGRPKTRVALMLLDRLERLAGLHEQQGRHDAPISLTRTQAYQLARALRLPNGELRWRGHPVNIVEDPHR
jgi:hypothetical protein